MCELAEGLGVVYRSAHMDDHTLTRYADLVVRVGLNLQPGQRLLVIGPLANGGVSLEAAPLVRRIAARAYDAGAPLVEALWGDEPLQLARFRHAPPTRSTSFRRGCRMRSSTTSQAGHAVLSVYANDPDLLHDAPAGSRHRGAAARPRARSVRSASRSRGTHELGGRRRGGGEVGRARVPRVCPRTSRCSRLWDAIARLCRLDAADPMRRGRRISMRLLREPRHLNGRRYTALRYCGPRDRR